jgi:hypothetical protein
VRIDAAVATSTGKPMSAARTGGRLNLFQRMMLRWRGLHPYNPVHVLRIPAPLDAARLRATIAQRLEALGLTGLELDRRRGRFRYHGGPAQVALAVVAAAGEPLPTLSRAIELEINRPFAAAAQENPFRFFVVDDGDGFHLALSYDHFAASGDSIARLLTAIALGYLDPAAPALAWDVDRYPATYRRVFLRHPGWALRAVLGLPRLVAQARHAYRPRYADVTAAANRFHYARIEPPQLRALLEAGKAWGVTLNDLLLAGLLLALAPLAEGRRHESRRTELAVASIVNMRQDFGPGAHEALSPCLAAFRVGHALPQGIGLRQLVQEVHAITAPIKRKRLYLQSICSLALSALIWPLLNPAQRHGLYSKHFPVWAGVTTLHLDPLWSRAGVGHAGRLDYLRAVPTGPLCPLVLAASTANEVLHFGFAFRTAAFAPATVARIAEDLVRSLDLSLAAPSP